MSWLRIDDGFAAHNKVLGISDAALRLWLMVGCWSRKLENLKHEGRISATVLPGVSQHRWPAKRLAELAAELVNATAGGLYEQGLWLATEGGWQVHDWRVYGVHGSEADSLSAKRSEAGKRGAASRWQTDGKPAGKQTVSQAANDAIVNAPNPNPNPNPKIPPTPTVLAPPGADRDIGSDDLAAFAPEPPKKKPKPQQWRRFPPDFEPDETHKRLALQLNVNLGREMAAIRDHEFAKPKSDPAATLRTWLRNAPKFAPGPSGMARTRADPRAEMAELNADFDARAAAEGSRRVQELLDFADKMRVSNGR